MTVRPDRPRIAWVDTGKGIAIALVVLFHATNWLGAAGLPVQLWTDTNLILSAIRLPMFFTLSGLFAAKWINAPRLDFWSVKLSLFVWVYGLWSVIATFTFMAGMHLQGAQGNYFAQFKETLQMAWAPRFELWFIWALAMMFVGIRLLRRIPVSIQIGLAGLASILTLSFEPDFNIGWEGLLKYSFFFLLGINAKKFYLWWAEQAPALLRWTVTVSAASLAAIGRFFGWSTTAPAYYFVVCCLGALAGIQLSLSLSRFSIIAQIGRQTLPVYLTHTSLIIGVCWLVAQLPAEMKTTSLGYLLPPLLALGVIPLCLAFSHFVSPRRILQNLYVQPNWFAFGRRSAHLGITEPPGP